MVEFFESIRSLETNRIIVEAITSSEGEDNREILFECIQDKVQEFAFDLLLEYSSRISPNYNRREQGFSDLIEKQTIWNNVYDYGVVENIGTISFRHRRSEKDIILEFRLAEFSEGSLKAKFEVIVMGLALISSPYIFLGGDLNNTMRYVDQYNSTVCLTEVSARRAEIPNYFTQLFDGFDEINLPKSEVEALANHSKSPDTKICALQVYLNAHISSDLKVDGIAGRETYLAWEAYKLKTGSNKSTNELLKDLVRDERSRWGFVGLIYNFVS